MARDISEEIVAIMPDLQRYAHYLSDSADAAQVLVQQAVEQVLKRQDHLAEVDDLKKYMFTILHNLHNDFLRKKPRGDQNIAEQEIIDPSLSAGERLACQQALDKMVTLSAAHQQVLQHVRAGQSYAAIAAELKLPLGTVMSRVSRARAALRQAMDMGPDETVDEWLKD